MKWKYTNIQHAPRIEIGLTPNEYCVADIVYKSQTHPDFSIEGWTGIGCHAIGEFLGFSSGTVHKMFERFEEWGLMEFSQSRKMKRMTAEWYDIAYLDSAAVQKVNVQKVNGRRSKSERHGVQKVNGRRSKSEHNNIIKELKTKDNEGGGGAKAKNQPQSELTPDTKAGWPDKLKSDQMFMETAMMVHKVKPEKMEGLLSRFLMTKRALEEDTWKSYSDFRKNFLFWLPKNKAYNPSTPPDKDAPPKYTPPPTSASARQAPPDNGQYDLSALEDYLKNFGASKTSAR